MGGEMYVGNHDSTGSGTYDRLVRIGARYNATSPDVSDGDDVYVLLDTSGRVIVSGAVAHDGVATGFPHRMGGVYRTTLPSVTAGDIADLLVSKEGRLRVEDYMVQQTRLGNQKVVMVNLTKTSTAEANAAAWTITSATTGYLAAANVSMALGTAETAIVRFHNDTTVFQRIVHGTGQHDINIIYPVPHRLAGNGTVSFRITVEQATTATSEYQTNLVGWEEA